MRRINIDGVQVTPQIQGNAEHWVATLYVDRNLAKGNLRAIMDQFCVEAGSGGPGQPFARHPHIRRVDGDVVFQQSGGLDI
jgi:hypothetical protein